MLQIRLICVGKCREPFWQDAAREYEKRLGAYCKLERIELPEERLPQQPSPGEISAALDKEAAAILTRIPAGTPLIALCVEGDEMPSEQFASWLGRAAATGTSRLCLLIGGSYGLAEQLKQRAVLRLSLSLMTFPHHLARVMLLEQLYRAMNILAGGKYHK